MKKLEKWMRKKTQKASELLALIDGERPGVDYLWEPGEKGPVPVVVFLRLPLHGHWSSRKVLQATVHFLETLGGACEIHGDKEAATMFFTFITVVEMALDRDAKGKKVLNAD